MKRKFAFAAAAASAVLILGACTGLKDALSAHTDRVAQAEGQELSVNRLATLLGKSRAPLRKDVAKLVANVWVDYQLLGRAAAEGDSLANSKAIDEAMWPTIANMKARKWYERVSQTWGTEDPVGAQAKFNSGELMAASHILLLTPQGTPDAAKAEAKRRLEGIRAQATVANFASLATTHSQDQGSAQQGGALGIFPKGAMVPEFERALRALKPGEISPVIQTQYGYHVLHRPTYDQVKGALLQASKGRSVAVAESTYLAKLEQSGKIEVKKGAVATVRALGADPDAYRKDNTVLATSSAGNFTTQRLIGWLETLPPNARVLEQIKQAPDSQITGLVKNFIKNELVLRQADSAKVTLDPAELVQMRKGFVTAVQAAWTQLGVAPTTLQTTKSGNDREKLVATRVDEYFTRMISEQAPFIPVPTPLATILREKYSYSFNAAGIDRAIEEATQIRNASASTTSAGQPPTAVPLDLTPRAASSTAPGAKR